LKKEKLDVCLTKKSNADEPFTGIRSLHKDVELLGQLFALGSVLLGFAGDARHKVVGHSSDSYGSEDIAKRGDKLGFDGFDSNVVDETFQSNLYKHIKGLAKDNKGQGRIEEN
jgi:hypothetical protein